MASMIERLHVEVAHAQHVRLRFYLSIFLVVRSFCIEQPVWVWIGVCAHDYTRLYMQHKEARHGRGEGRLCEDDRKK